MPPPPAAPTSGQTPGASTGPTVSLITLGCARNEVDSEELAGRLERDGYRLVEDASGADAVLVNTCGFIEAAKKDSIDTILAAADQGSRAVVAVGCLAERYGTDLADALPEADAVLSFDDYPDIADRLRSVLDGDAHAAHTPRDRRKLLPISPVDRAAAASAGRADPDLPIGLAPASGPRAVRRRLGSGPVAPLKLASGCDRRCSFCAIPSFRGAFLSRPAADVLAEARWLAAHGVRELFLVSENSTSYGKDLGDLRLLERMLPDLAATDGIRRVRISYLQPAEMRPGLVTTIAETAGVASYFDLSFQHASGPVLRRMRRFGDAEQFLALLDMIRAASPVAGVRSNVIVGFPGETEADVEILCDFLSAARLDAIGVFGYSDEDGTEAVGLGGKLDDEEIRARVDAVSRLAEELIGQRAEDRVTSTADVLVEKLGSAHDEPPEGTVGRAEHQGPEVDGITQLTELSDGVAVGDVVHAVVTGSNGIDLTARALRVVR